MKKRIIQIVVCIVCISKLNAQTPTTVAPRLMAAMPVAPVAAAPAAAVNNGNFAILATGEATSFINSASNPGASTSGSLGFRHANDKRSLSLLLKVASTTQPLTKGWATSIVSPLASQSSTIGSIVFDGYFKLNNNPFLRVASDRWYINAYAGFTSTSWQTDSIKNAVNNASISYLGVLLSYDLFKGTLGSTPVSSSVKFGLTSRFIGGDITNLSGADSLNYKTYILPTSKKAWISPEIDALISIGKVVGKFQATWFSDGSLGNKTASKGFTGLQLSFGLNVSIEVIEGLLN